MHEQRGLFTGKTPQEEREDFELAFTEKKEEIEKKNPLKRRLKKEDRDIKMEQAGKDH